ncbi:hypothetical protein KIPB_005759 [Kipferlia bialata]|uniref:Uncharacterized protein n=1 Tax=Kipferlia bialata TaxID=797122 RepID=A0A9K3GJA9_9EUKA|nr:hypothetical protein KIPB_005759 [Kipferlia bialata]|eukprot:g5759.t1
MVYLKSKWVPNTVLLFSEVFEVASGWTKMGKYLTVNEWEEMWAPAKEELEHTFAFAYCKAKEEGIDLGPIPDDMSDKWRHACENGIDWNTYKPPPTEFDGMTEEELAEVFEEMTRDEGTRVKRAERGRRVGRTHAGGERSRGNGTGRRQRCVASSARVTPVTSAVHPVTRGVRKAMAHAAVGGGRDRERENGQVRRDRGVVSRRPPCPAFTLSDTESEEEVLEFGIDGQLLK